MRYKKIYLRTVAFLFFIIAFLILNVETPIFAEDIKNPNVSGAFYPSNAKALSSLVDGFISEADVDEVSGDIFALISPHAGYIYSGPIAAYGYKAIQSKKYKTVVILAPSHFFGFNGISIWPEGSFVTPLGSIPVDDIFSQELIIKVDKIRVSPEVFSKEHSLEVQLPFLQKVLGNNFKIVPVIMGQISLDSCKQFAKALKEVMDKRDGILIVASTDLSHYHPYDEAVYIDKNTLSYISDFDFQGLWNEASLGNVELCGLRPVATTLILAKEYNINIAKVLKYANSGDTAGDKKKVVGYGSVILYSQEKEIGEDAMLNKEQRKKLLEIVRESFGSYVTTGKRRDFSVDDPVLSERRGAFVTLTKNGQLRGCIGRLVADKPLFQVVAGMAIEAAVKDPRFPPITQSELSDIEIEISVLSPFEKIDDVNKIKVGKHGIMIRRGFNSGLLLPQVATEYGWDRNTFLEHTCQKAGLPSDTWKDKLTEIYIFSAEVFSEVTD